MSRERPIEPGVFVVATVAVATTAVGIGIAGGDVAGWGFPGSVAAWGLGFVLSGAVIERAHPGHSVGRLLLWAGLTAAVVQLAVQAGTSFGNDMLIVAVESFGWMVPIGLLFTAIARFPDGVWATQSVRVLVVAMWSAAGLAVVVGLTAPYRGADPDVANPLSAAVWDGIPGWVAQIPYGLFTVLFIAIGVTVAVVSLRGDAVHRRQIGWVMFGVVALALSGLVAATLDGPYTVGVTSLLTALAVLLVPAGIVIAITRYRLYEIDRIVSRTVTYVVVVGVLVAGYFGLVLALRSLLPVEGPLPVALSTLAVAFAFFPLARRVQGFVDRRFFRSRYDAAAVVAAFADELRTTLDPSVAAGRAESVVAETFQAESVAVWLAEEPA